MEASLQDQSLLPPKVRLIPSELSHGPRYVQQACCGRVGDRSLYILCLHLLGRVLTDGSLSGRQWSKECKEVTGQAESGTSKQNRGLTQSLHIPGS